MKNKTMPSAFICSQAELLVRTKDTFSVLQNIRDKYALSSFPSQMSRVKEEWYSFADRHKDFDAMCNRGLKYLIDERVSSKYLEQYKNFVRDDIKTQLAKSKKASSGEGLTGSRRTDSAISRIRILPEYMEDYRLSKDDITKIKTRSSESLDKRAMDCIIVENGEELVRRCTRILKDLTEDVFLVVAATAVLCGRRSIEILRVGEFEQCYRGEYSCAFSGGAKKRDIESSPCEIPLLIKCKYIKRAIDFIRERVDIKDMTNSQINSKYSHKLGDSAKILLNSLHTRFHDLRAIYGTITHHCFHNKCSINVWLKRVLLHENIDTSVFYSRCKVSNNGKTIGEWLIEK